MNWSHFLTYNEAPTHAFEALCNQLFELWINRTYGEDKKTYVVVNGSGGDGGVEAYSTLMDGNEVGVQAKWFPDSINSSQFTQIKNSILTAKSVHPNLIEYIVCVPRDLSNVKVGKNGQLVKNTEHSKWEKCVADINAIYPDMKIYFWGDYILTEQLQYTEAAGVRQYWFDKEELTKEALQYSFEKQKSGWLAQRYIPVLHNQGKIHEKISSFLGDQQECDSLIGKLNLVEKKYQDLYKKTESLCEALQGQKQYNDKIEMLQEISRRTLLQLAELVIIRDAFTYENKLPDWQEHVMSDGIVYEMKEWTKKHSFGDLSSHFGSMEKALEAVCEINLTQLCEKLGQRSTYGKILVIGAQGTGKTHGIANEVEILLKEGYMIPVLIQAKSVPYNDDWKDILIHILGLAQIWGEDELWTALEAMTYRIERNHPLEDNGVKIMPKVLICIDGIDEVKPYSRWIERINQVNAIVARHPRIRFCFTGRQYAFDKSALVQEQKYKMVYLSDDGDVPVKNIYDGYIQHYHVNDEGATWIRYSISTPYALKLMCEIYQGGSICNFGKSDVTVTELLKRKFAALDQEFKASIGLDESVQINIIKTVLIKLNDMFQVNDEVSGSEIKRDLRQHTIFQYLHETGLDQVLDFLEKQSFLQSYHKLAQSIFEEEETIYLLGAQPVYDYLKALRLYEKGEYTDDLMIEDIIMENTSVMQMYSVMILERDGSIVWNNKSCREYLYEEDLFHIVAFALANVDIKFSGKYQEWIAAIMRKDAYTLGQVVNYVILPLARYAGHALGSRLLDNYLKEFEKPAERDLVWSVPTGLGHDENSRWGRFDDINYDDDTNRLEDTDQYDGLPLVWAWGLSSVDNYQRTMVRQELTKWGIAQPGEFLKLFLHFSDINDAQIYADLFSIAMAVSYVCRTNHVFLKELTHWILHNIFDYEKIKNIHNAAIRYYARAIMECAFSEKIITKKQIEKCRPPYKISTSLLPFSVEATNGTRMGGYKTLDYDLARYVLCDPISRMFLNNRDYKNKINALLKKYGKKYGIENLTSEKFILGSAFGYIKQAGWNERDFYGKPNGGKAGEAIGVDIAIIRKYYPATHGSMSKIMSITEKYAWCAKMEILGYLADRLLYDDYNDSNTYVHDYGIMEDYVNPYQELRQIDLDNVMAETKWMLPESLVPYIKACSFSEKGIRKWLQESPIPNFSKWIQITEREVTLYATHIMNNDEQGVTTMMWISSGLIHKGTMPKLLQALNNDNFIQSLYNAADILAYPETDCYISPLEVCWYDWKEELDSEILFGKNALYKNVARCVCDIQNGGENYYELPSKIVRKLLGIITGDGYHYFNSAGEEIAYCTSAGERYGDCQHILLANKKLFYSKVKEAGLQPVWIIRVLKESSVKARERFDFFADKDETYLVWKSNRKWLSRKLENK